MRRWIPATIIASFSTAPLISCQQHYDCDVTSYYSTVSDLTNRDDLHSLVKTTHRASLPYTSPGGSGKADVWDALASLDSDEAGERIRLVYGDRYVPLVPRDGGSCEHWNREHLWPRSRGVGDAGYDNTDLHHLRPADCNVNAARGNLLFGSCDISCSACECTAPAHLEAAVDTQRNGVSFLPPANQRGDIARAILYMDLRYDGDEDNVENLIVTDCPEDLPGAMGYLSQLLQWHIDYPPDESEKRRNDSICKNWQGNRNPFIDHPELVSSYFGSPRKTQGGGLGYDCSLPHPPASPTSPSTPSSPSPADKSDTCHGMEHGDVAVIGIKSLDPDTVILLALADLLGGSSIYMSDNAWTGMNLKSNEGVLRLDIPPAGISKGSLFGFDPSFSSTLNSGGSWSKMGGSFALSESGDNVMVYCIKSDDSPLFLFGALYQNAWSPDNADPSSFSTHESARPGHLPGNCALSLIDEKKNWWYRGARKGKKSELLNSISDPSSWSGNDISFDLNTNEEFQISKGSSIHKFLATNLLCLALAVIFLTLL